MSIAQVRLRGVEVAGEEDPVPALHELVCDRAERLGTAGASEQAVDVLVEALREVEPDLLVEAEPGRRIDALAPPGRTSMPWVVATNRTPAASSSRVVMVILGGLLVAVTIALGG